MQSLFGLLVFTAIAWLLTENRARVRWPGVAGGVAMQLGLALLLLKFPLFNDLFRVLNRLVLLLETATKAGTGFVFGYLGGGPLPFTSASPGGGFILAFQALPLVLLVSALSALLYYWRILPWVVRGFSEVLRKFLGIGGALGLGATMNIFVGMVEAPLLIRPYLKEMTRSELFGVMVCGMATIAGTMMVLYAGIVGSVVPDAMGHILSASIISAPAALTVALLMVPETGSATAGERMPPSSASSSMDAVTQGTADGLQLLLHIVAMLVVLVALVALGNQLLALLPEVGGQALTLQKILGWIMAPIAWLMGIPWAEAPTAGALLGVKTILNEFLAYLEMTQLPEGALSDRSRLIMTYALCGFANLGSLGIMIGGMGNMVPERRQEIIALGPKSVLAGTLATCMTGAVVGLLAW